MKFSRLWNQKDNTNKPPPYKESSNTKEDKPVQVSSPKLQDWKEKLEKAKIQKKIKEKERLLQQEIDRKESLPKLLVLIENTIDERVSQGNQITVFRIYTYSRNKWEYHDTRSISPSDGYTKDFLEWLHADIRILKQALKEHFCFPIALYRNDRERYIEFSINIK